MPQSLFQPITIIEQARKKKAGIYLVISEKVIIFAPDDESLIWLVARHRGFFDAIHSRTWRLERFLIRNPQNQKSPELPLFTKELRNLTKIRKNERNANGKCFSFHFRVLSKFGVAKVTKSRAQDKETCFFFCRDGITLPLFMARSCINEKIDERFRFHMLSYLTCQGLQFIRKNVLIVFKIRRLHL